MPLSHSWPKQPPKRVISLIHCSFLQVHWHYSFHFLGHCFFHFFGHYFFHFLGHCFFHFLGSFFFLWGTAPYLFTFLNSLVSTPPSQLGWFLQDAPAWVCQPSSLQYVCLHTPGSAFWSRSRLLPSTSSTKVASHLVSCDLQSSSWLWFAYRRTKLWAAYHQLPRASLTTEE